MATLRIPIGEQLASRWVFHGSARLYRLGRRRLDLRQQGSLCRIHEADQHDACRGRARETRRYLRTNFATLGDQAPEKTHLFEIVTKLVASVAWAC
jgi:hypothetical protein